MTDSAQKGSTKKKGQEWIPLRMEWDIKIYNNISIFKFLVTASN